MFKLADDVVGNFCGFISGFSPIVFKVEEDMTAVFLDKTPLLSGGEKSLLDKGLGGDLEDISIYPESVLEVP